MTLTKRATKGTALTYSELDGNFTHLGGDGSYQFPATDGNSGQVLTTDGSGNLSFANAGSTGDLTFVGSTVISPSNADITLDPSGSGSINFHNQYTFPTADGSNGQALVSDGSGNLTFSSISVSQQISFEIKTSDFTAITGRRYMVDTNAGGEIDGTLPASPSAGDTVEFTHGGVNGWGNPNNFIVIRNGSTIEGSASNYTFSGLLAGNMATFIFDGSTWRVR